MDEAKFLDLLEQFPPHPRKWLSEQEVMQRLKITRKTELQKMRHEGKIHYTQPAKGIIMYDSDSIK